MNVEELKSMLDKAEQMGFTRGVLTILKQIFDEMEAEGKTLITLNSIKGIYEEYKKPEYQNAIIK